MKPSFKLACQYFIGIFRYIFWILSFIFVKQLLLKMKNTFKWIRLYGKLIIKKLKSLLNINLINFLQSVSKFIIDIFINSISVKFKYVLAKKE